VNRLEHARFAGAEGHRFEPYRAYQSRNNLQAQPERIWEGRGWEFALMAMPDRGRASKRVRFAVAAVAIMVIACGDRDPSRKQRRG
jgi:hypothetical protein